MPLCKLTKRTVDSVLPGPKRMFLYDEDLSGFGLTVTPAGSKTYFVEYRAGRGRGAPTRRMVIGAAGRITPDEARRMAKKTLGDVAHGDDPASKRTSRRKEGTVRELADRYLNEHVHLQNKPRTAEEVKRLLNHSILPTLGNKKISDLTRADIARWHHSLRAAPYAANRALAVLRKMLSLAVRTWELRVDNPALAVKPFPEKERERFFADNELALIGRALADMESTGQAPSWFILATRLLALSGMRLGEVMGLLWPDVDFARGGVWLQDAKAGARMVPLNEPAIAC